MTRWLVKEKQSLRTFCLAATWKVQKSAFQASFHCFVINPQLAPGGLRMPISILCFGKGPCAAALRLRPFISRLKGEAGRGEEEEQFQRHTLVCQSRPSKTFSYEKKIFHQCIISDSWAWAFNEIFSTADLWWWSMRCIGNHCRREKNFCQTRVLLTTFLVDDLSWFIAMATRAIANLGIDQSVVTANIICFSCSSVSIAK